MLEVNAGTRKCDPAVPETMEDTNEIVLDSLLSAVGQLDAPQSDADLMEILERILDGALKSVHAEDGSLLVRDDDTKELVFALVHGNATSQDLLWRRLHAGKGIVSWVVEHGEAAGVNDTHTDRRFYDALDREFSFQTRSVLAAPIIAGEEVLGAIEVLNKQNGLLFGESDRLRLAQLCRVAGDLLYAMIRELDRKDTSWDRHKVS